MSGETKPSNSENTMATSSSSQSNSQSDNISDVSGFNVPPPSRTWARKELTASQKLLKKSKDAPYVPIGEFTVLGFC